MPSFLVGGNEGKKGATGVMIGFATHLREFSAKNLGRGGMGQFPIEKSTLDEGTRSSKQR